MKDHIIFDRQNLVLRLLDQRLLPCREEYFICEKVDDVVSALKTMVIRGAPAIGVTAAYGCVLSMASVMDKSDWRDRLQIELEKIATARPTAVNLAWAVKKMSNLIAHNKNASAKNILADLIALAEKIHADDIAICKKIGIIGSKCINNGDCILTHCNAGALATSGYGTALGVIRAAFEEGKQISVIADETRPFLQGARLTAWELHQDGIPVRVACDNSAAMLMQKKLVQSVVVGADRIAANGDTANKIGTFGLAILAKHFGIPFYIAAPLSTIDLETATGKEIPIEERPPEEVVCMTGQNITPDGVDVFNFAFDVTSADLISGIITEAGLLLPPFRQSIADAFKRYQEA